MRKIYSEKELIRRHRSKGNAVLYYAPRKGMLHDRVYIRCEVRDFMGLSETDANKLETKSLISEYSRRDPYKGAPLKALLD